MRIFYGIDFSNERKEQMYKTNELLDSYIIKGKKSRKNNLHLTLRYIGEIQSNQLNEHLLITNRLNEFIQTFSLITEERLGHFRKNEDVIWIGIKPNDLLNELVSTLDYYLRDLQIYNDSHYTPHITLYRGAKLSQALEQIPIELENLKLPISKVTLFESKQVDGVLTYVPLND